MISFAEGAGSVITASGSLGERVLVGDRGVETAYGDESGILKTGTIEAEGAKLRDVSTEEKELEEKEELSREYVNNVS